MLPRPAAPPAVLAAVLAVVVALALAGCGGPAGSPAPTGSPSASASSGAPAITEAATLRAAFDTVFRESVDLTGYAVQTAVARGSRSAAEKGALAALSRNTSVLTSVFGDVYGSGPRTGFIEVWRPRVGYLLGYATGLLAHRDREVARAGTGLARSQSAFAAFLQSTTKLPAGTVRAGLTGQLPALEAAIRAIVARSPGAGRALETAAGRMDRTAGMLAEVIVTSKDLAGNPAAPAARLRAGLTGQLVQYVAATMFLAQTVAAAKGSLGDPEVRGAVAALADDTAALSGTVAGVLGAADGSRFRGLWTAQVGFLVRYAAAEARTDDAQLAAARTGLTRSAADIARFVHGVTALPAAAMARDLRSDLRTLERAIGSTAAGSEAAGATVAAAEGQISNTATLLASGLAAARPGF